MYTGRFLVLCPHPLSVLPAWVKLSPWSILPGFTVDLCHVLAGHVQAWPLVFWGHERHCRCTWGTAPPRITEAPCPPPLAKVVRKVLSHPGSVSRGQRGRVRLLPFGPRSSAFISTRACLSRILEVALSFLWLEVDKLGKHHGAVKLRGLIQPAVS